MHLRNTLTVLCLLLFNGMGVAQENLADVCSGDQWPMFRGLGASLSEAKDLPLNWSNEAGIAWRVDLPGFGQSSPVIWGDNVFVTTMQGNNKEAPTVLCFDLETGNEIWRREFESSQEIEASTFTSRSAPTPCVDADRVYAFFESGDLFTLDHDGKTVWQRSLVEEYGESESEFGIGSSSLLVGGKLIVPMFHAGPSYLLAIDPATGKNLWKSDIESRVSWSTPTTVNNDQFVISTAGVVECYSVTTGKRVWQIEGFEGNNIPTPTVHENKVFIGAGNRSNCAAIQIEGEEATEAWRSDAVTCSFGSPLYYGGHVYFVNKSGVGFCTDATTGEVVWKKRLPESCWASPLAANGRIYLFGKKGTTTILKPGSQFESLGENKLTVSDGSLVYGVAAVHGRFLIRTGTTLVAIGVEDE